jgi:hypothetical protein
MWSTGKSSAALRLERRKSDIAYVLRAITAVGSRVKSAQDCVPVMLLKLVFLECALVVRAHQLASASNQEFREQLGKQDNILSQVPLGRAG